MHYFFTNIHEYLLFTCKKYTFWVSVKINLFCNRKNILLKSSILVMKFRNAFLYLIRWKSSACVKLQFNQSHILKPVQIWIFIYYFFVQYINKCSKYIIYVYVYQSSWFYIRLSLVSTIIQFFGWYELYGGGVNAITFACRLRSIVEHMAHVRIAYSASHLRAYPFWMFNK